MFPYPFRKIHRRLRARSGDEVLVTLRYSTRSRPNCVHFSRAKCAGGERAVAILRDGPRIPKGDSRLIRATKRVARFEADARRRKNAPPRKETDLARLRAKSERRFKLTGSKSGINQSSPAPAIRDKGPPFAPTYDDESSYNEKKRDDFNGRLLFVQTSPRARLLIARSTPNPVPAVRATTGSMSPIGPSAISYRALVKRSMDRPFALVAPTRMELRFRDRPRAAPPAFSALQNYWIAR